MQRLASEPSRIDIYGGVGGNGGEGGREGGGGGAGQGPTTSFGGIQFVIDRLTMDSGPAGWFRAEGTSSGMDVEVMRTPHVSHSTSFESPLSLPPTVYSESRNYCDQLLYQGRGFPLYVPKPGRNLPAEYQREGVAIGDVGTVTAEGSFDFFFNIYLPANHPINAHIPQDFVPLPGYDASDVCDEHIEDMNYVTSPSARETNGDFSAPGREFVFTCRGPNGAVLALPHGRHLRRLLNILAMRDYAAEHAHRWYKHVNEARGRGLVNGSLYLVTGYEKAKSWGMASFYGVSLPGQNEFQLSFRPTDADTGKYRWRAPNCRHKQADPPPVEGTPLNQTIFIHAFAVSLSETIWGGLFGHVEVSQLVGDRTSPETPGRDFIPYGRQGSSSIWSFFGGSHGTTSGERQYSGGVPTHKSVIMSDASPIPQVFHPSQIIHERILRQTSQARVVITHDDDWRDVFKAAGKGLVGQTFSELQQAIFDRFEITEEGGAVFLRPKSESPEMEMEPIPPSSMKAEETESPMGGSEQASWWMQMSDSRMNGFAVGSAYTVQDVIGEGAYGVVVSAVHAPTQRRVAIKRITPFDHSMFCLRTLREIKLLRHFHHENIIAILDILRPTSLQEFNEVYLVQELMETDLHRVIRTQELSDDHCQYFIYQTLRALKALHSADVLHRDLKPSNLLLNANCDLKLCDFGLARSARPPPNVANDSSTFMTEYVATRWYRAPEVMLTFKEYTRAIDMWSVGCVLAEMLSGKPLFPGRDYHHQLSIILDILGTPSIDDFYAISSQRSREYIRALPFRKKRPFAALFPKANPDALDLMEKCLTFSPKRRIEVTEALAHPYLSPYHDPADEPTADPIDPSFFDFDNGDPLGKEDLKVLIYEEITRPDNPSAPFVLQSVPPPS